MARNRNSRLKSGDSSGGSGWELVYSGFVLILLCFFIMLSSFASIEQGKVMRFVKSFVNSVSILTGGLKFDSGKRMVHKSPDIIDKEDEIANILREVRKFVNKKGQRSWVTVFSSDKGLTMRLSNALVFEVGMAEISSEATPLLKKIASIISKTKYAVRIEGHTDNLPIHTKRFASNWELSTTRAVNVLRYFVEKEKIPPFRLSAVGFGEFQPISPNDSPENRARNRRVEIVFVTQENDTNSA